MKSAKIRLLGELRYSPFREALVLLFLAVAVVPLSYAASLHFASWIYFLVGLVAAIVLMVQPIWIGLALFLLWKNPAKYKEKGMKDRRRRGKLND